jgi:hypothetical protein
MPADSSAVPAEVRARMAMHERHDAERAALTERQSAERADEGIDLTPVATWNAFAPDQLAEVIAGVTRCEGALAVEAVRRVAKGGTYEFSTERRDPFGGQLIGGARWLAEHDPGIYATWRLHLLLAEPAGVA